MRYGNGIINSDEECDDNNTKSLDGCSNMCELEMGFYCN